jgi:hypothetical protein
VGVRRDLLPCGKDVNRGSKKLTPRKIFGPEEQKIRGRWKISYNKNLHKEYYIVGYNAV